MAQSQLHRADQRELSSGSLVKFQKGKSCLRAVRIAGILVMASEEMRRRGRSLSIEEDIFSVIALILLSHICPILSSFFLSSFFQVFPLVLLLVC